MIYESITQASAAASRACIILSKDSLESEAAISQVDEVKCKGCGACVEVCPFKAIELRSEETLIEKVLFESRKAHVNPIICKGCGSCAVACPLGAIAPQHFTSGQIESSLDAAIIRIPTLKLLAKTSWGLELVNAQHREHRRNTQVCTQDEQKRSEEDGRESYLRRHESSGGNSHLGERLLSVRNM